MKSKQERGIVMTNGTIFNIQKFCINDGPGIRTTVFLKGCPLNCLWCHNPESKSRKRGIFYDAKKCIGCRACAQACVNECHVFTEEGHRFQRDRCVSCGNCVSNCVTEALETVGYEISVEDVLKEVMKDEIFYQTSGGGMTLSGGEPMAQFEFTYELLKAAKEKGLHTCMETCGFASPEKYQKVQKTVDIFLFDYKITDPQQHIRCTGVENTLILQNLHMLDALGADIVLRCPIIPGINDTTEHFAGIAQTANGLKHILEINIEPYHPLGAGKSEMLGQAYPLRDLTFPEQTAVDMWINDIQAQTQVCVKKA